ncbi:hypothetical protein ACFOSW_21450 [Paenibacillus sp. GCM10012303]
MAQWIKVVFFAVQTGVKTRKKLDFSSFSGRWIFICTFAPANRSGAFMVHSKIQNAKQTYLIGGSRATHPRTD